MITKEQVQAIIDKLDEQRKNAEDDLCQWGSNYEMGRICGLEYAIAQLKGLMVQPTRVMATISRPHDNC